MPIEPIYTAVLVSIGMLAVANLFYGAIARQRWSHNQKNIAYGLMFSTCAIMVMANSVMVLGVFYYDVRNIFVVIGAAYGGPIAAVICTVFVGAFRMFQGGEAATLGVSSIALVAGLAAGWGRLMRQEYQHPALIPLMVLGMISSLPLAITPYLPLAVSATNAFDLAVALALFNIILMLLFGCLLTREARLFENEKQLEAEAKTDGLTGLLNRRSFNVDLELAFMAKAPSSVLLIDLDHFKKINDAFGHDAGDKVLVECARILKASVRAMDPVYRIGGEEFAVLLRHSPSEMAYLIAVSIAQAIRCEPVCFQNSLIPFTASIGVVTGAAIGKHTTDIDLALLLKQADVALYRAKSNGRDQVVVFSDEVSILKQNAA